jgi:hypothetical protein
MKAEPDLDHAYAEWRRLAEAEGKAIREGNWLFVAECQQAIGRLRATVDQLIQQAHQETPSPDAQDRKLSRRANVLELIELQRLNLTSLQQRRQRLANHIEQLSCAGRNLRGIQRSYAPPATPAWSSYS